MRGALADLKGRGATPNEVCFIFHKFIPAIGAAWALAKPDQQVVRVDSLWGLPDGLQYLPHDSSVPTLIEQSQLVGRNGLGQDDRLQRK
jgi:hypothetical protein